MLAASVCFFAGLFYQTCVTWVNTHGVATTPEPWYAQGVIVCFWPLLMCGLKARPALGKALAIALTLLVAWIAAVTFFAKLLPSYAGGITKSTLAEVAGWWRGHPSQDLATVIMVPVPVLFSLLALFAFLLLAATVIIIVQFLREAGDPSAFALQSGNGDWR